MNIETISVGNLNLAWFASLLVGWFDKGRLHANTPNTRHVPGSEIVNNIWFEIIVLSFQGQYSCFVHFDVLREIL